MNTATMIATKPEIRRKSLNMTASRMPPTMHRRDCCASAPTISATTSASRMGARMEPGPDTLLDSRLLPKSSTSSSATMSTGNTSPSAMLWR